MNRKLCLFAVTTFVTVISLIFLSSSALAEGGGVLASAASDLDVVCEAFKEAANSWAAQMVHYGNIIFMVLAAISAVMNLLPLALKSASMGDILHEVVKYILMIGFFMWLMNKAPQFSRDIIEGMAGLPSKMGGVDIGFKPSEIFDVGSRVWDQAMSIQVGSFGGNLGIFLCACVLAGMTWFLCGVIAVNVMIQQVTVWLFAYAGIIFLGFGANRFTRDMAIGYYKSIFGQAASLMGMLLLINVAVTLVNKYIGPGQTIGEKIPDGFLNNLFILLMIVFLINKLMGVLPNLMESLTKGGTGTGAFGGTASMAQGAAAMMLAAKSMQGAVASLRGIGKALGAGAAGIGTSMIAGADSALNRMGAGGAGNIASIEGRGSSGSASESLVNNAVSNDGGSSSPSGGGLIGAVAPSAGGGGKAGEKPSGAVSGSSESVSQEASVSSSAQDSAASQNVGGAVSSEGGKQAQATMQSNTGPQAAGPVSARLQKLSDSLSGYRQSTSATLEGAKNRAAGFIGSMGGLGAFAVGLGGAAAGLVKGVGSVASSALNYATYADNTVGGKLARALNKNADFSAERNPEQQRSEMNAELRKINSTMGQFLSAVTTR